MTGWSTSDYGLVQKLSGRFLHVANIILTSCGLRFWGRRQTQAQTQARANNVVWINAGSSQSTAFRRTPAMLRAMYAHDADTAMGRSLYDEMHSMLR
jgi:hypothetical protein